MIQTTKLYKELFESGAIQEYRITIDSVQYDSDVIYDNVEITGSLFDKGTLTIGSFTSGLLKVKLKIPSENIPKNAEVIYEYRYTDGERNSEWIEKFAGKITKRTKFSDEITTVEVRDVASNYDRFLDIYPDTITSYPANARYVTTLCATHLGLEVDNLSDIINQNVVEYPNEMTVVEVLQNIAALSGGNFIVVQNKLRIVILKNDIGIGVTWNSFAGVTWNDLSDTMWKDVSVITYPAQGQSSHQKLEPISKVVIYYDDERAFESGDDSGSIMEISSKWATQNATDYVLSVLDGYEYIPVKSEKVYIDPAVEIGDGFAVNGGIQVVANVKWIFDGSCTAEIEMPMNNEVAYDDPYNQLIRNEFAKKVSLGDSYQGITIDRQKGLEMLLSPDGIEENAVGKAYFDLNRGMAFQYREDSTKAWEDWLYFDKDEKIFKLSLYQTADIFNDFEGAYETWKLGVDNTIKPGNIVQTVLGSNAYTTDISQLNQKIDAVELSVERTNYYNILNNGSGENDDYTDWEFEVEEGSGLSFDIFGLNTNNIYKVKGTFFFPDAIAISLRLNSGGDDTNISINGQQRVVLNETISVDSGKLSFGFVFAEELRVMNAVKNTFKIEEYSSENVYIRDVFDSSMYDTMRGVISEIQDYQLYPHGMGHEAWGEYFDRFTPTIGLDGYIYNGDIFTQDDYYEIDGVTNVTDIQDYDEFPHYWNSTGQWYKAVRYITARWETDDFDPQNKYRLITGIANPFTGGDYTLLVTSENEHYAYSQGTIRINEIINPTAGKLWFELDSSVSYMGYYNNAYIKENDFFIQEWRLADGVIEIFEILEDTTSLAGHKLSFHTNGIATNGLFRIVQGRDYSYSVKRTTGSQTFSIDVNEYDTNKDFIQKKTYVFDTNQSVEKTNLDSFDSDTLYISITYNINGVSPTNRLELTEVMMNIGEPQEWNALKDATYVYDWARGEFNIQTDLISQKVSQRNFTGNKIVSEILQTSTTIKLTADAINLEGLVTANQNFKILLDGSIEAHNATFSGNVIAGKIGDWNIESGKITSDSGEIELNANNEFIKFGNIKLNYSRTSIWDILEISGIDNPALVRVSNDYFEPVKFEVSNGIHQVQLNSGRTGEMFNNPGLMMIFPDSALGFWKMYGVMLDNPTLDSSKDSVFANKVVVSGDTLYVDEIYIDGQIRTITRDNNGFLKAI